MSHRHVFRLLIVIINGAPRAVGIVEGSRLNFPSLARGELCYTPIEKILDTFKAMFPPGQI